MRANAPGDNLYVTISVQHPKLGDYFTAVLKAKRVPSSLVSDHAMFFWLMPHKVAVWIYWHVSRIGSSLELSSVVFIQINSTSFHYSYLGWYHETFSP